MALVDVLGIASILPFISVITNPEIFKTNQFFEILDLWLKPLSNQELQTILGLIFLAFLILSLGVKAYTSYKLMRFSLMREFNLSRRLFRGYLYQNYSWFLSRNSSELAKTVLSEISLVVNNAFTPALNLFSQFTLLIAIFLFLLYMNPLLTLGVIFFIGGIYALIVFFVSKHLTKLGKQRLEANSKRFFHTNESFSAIKEVKFLGLEEIFLQRFTKPAKIYAEKQAVTQAIGILPRYALEMIAFGGIVAATLMINDSQNSLTEVMPTISLFAYAGYKMLPSIQQVYYSITQLRSASAAVDVLFNDLNEHKTTSKLNEKDEINFNNLIKVENISYKYPGADYESISNLYMDIKFGENIGIVGSTGSGKTTLVDILLGLLTPQSGSISIDGKKITEKNLRSWQSILGYVPQNVLLADATIEENIAFGQEDINHKKISESSKLSFIHDFISNELNKGYKTNVGQRGVKLSGGQIQRIGIARALYNTPQILILDEATSALDNTTESFIMDSLKKMTRNITIIQIAHRLSTIKNCDRIIFLDKGRISAIGSYKQLIKDCELFRKMTEQKKEI